MDGTEDDLLWEQSTVNEPQQELMEMKKNRTMALRLTPMMTRSPTKNFWNFLVHLTAARTSLKGFKIRTVPVETLIAYCCCVQMTIQMIYFN